MSHSQNNMSTANIRYDMTTNIMFLRDMKTMTKQYKSQQGVNVLAKAMVLVMPFLGGGMASEAWGVIS